MRFFLFLLLFIAAPALAEQVSLAPPGVRVEFRAYGFGLIPFDGKFTRFHGWLRYDPAHADACEVVLEVEASSLTMADDLIRAEIAGPAFMDVARFPNMAFHGACQGDAIDGSLLLHGENHPFALDSNRSPQTITATGRLNRAQWGITARPLIAGSTIRIHVEIPNPVSGPHT